MKTFTHEEYLSPFTWRYGSEEMRLLWGEVNRRKQWRRVWVALAAAQSEVGLVSAEQLADLRAFQDKVDLPRAQQLEEQLRHELMSEIRAYAEQCTVGGGIIHLGATSMDVLDNAEVLRMRDALVLIDVRLRKVLGALVKLIQEWADVPTMAFTHLQPAEPTTVGYRLAQYAQDLLMDWESLQTVRRNLRGKGIKGAVGTSASFATLLEGTSMTTAAFEARVMELLELPAFSIATQTYPRKQDLQIGGVLVSIAGSLYKLAFDLRVLQSPPIGEWAEPFGSSQVGSSAMPFKRNPIKAENINSLGRWAAAQMSVLWDNAAHSLLERTLDDSANRRMVLPGLFLAVDEMLIQGANILEDLQINMHSIQHNMAVYGPFAAIERLLMKLAKAGADRQEMHDVLREHSLAAWDAVQRRDGNPLVELVALDAELLEYLSEAEIRAAMHSDDYVGDAPQRAREFAAHVQNTLQSAAS